MSENFLKHLINIVADRWSLYKTKQSGWKTTKAIVFLFHHHLFTTRYVNGVGMMRVPPNKDFHTRTTAQVYLPTVVPTASGCWQESQLHSCVVAVQFCIVISTKNFWLLFTIYSWLPIVYWRKMLSEKNIEATKRKRNNWQKKKEKNATLGWSNYWKQG